MIMKRAIAAALFVLALVPAARAQELEVGRGGDATVVVVNTVDGSSRFRISFRVFRTGSDVVDVGNAAVAVASCEGCQTAAISFQVVLVSSDPSVVTPTNLAIALNIECYDCETLASAYQWVLGTDGQVHFSPEGNRVIAEIRRRLYSLIRSDLSILEIQAELDALAAELQQVLAEELVSAGPPDLSVEEVPAGADGVPTDPADEPDAGTASPDATPATEASPDETPTEEPSESPTPVESSPSPEVTPEESPTTSATP